LLGSTSVNHTLHDTRPILHIASIWFDAVILLNLSGITVIKSYGLEEFPRAALRFTNIFTLQVSQIAVHSESGGIDTESVFGNSVIEHSSFDMIRYGSHISMHLIDCPLYMLYLEKSACAILQVLHVYLNSYYHKISIRNCIFKCVGGESIHAELELNSFPVQIGHNFGTFWQVLFLGITGIGQQLLLKLCLYSNLLLLQSGILDAKCFVQRTARHHCRTTWKHHLCFNLTVARQMELLFRLLCQHNTSCITIDNIAFYKIP